MENESKDHQKDTVITEVSIHRVALPLAKAYTVSYGTVTHTSVVIVGLKTAGGLVGWGEASPLKGFTSECPEGIVEVLQHVLAPILIGRNALDRNSINHALHATPGNHMAKGAIDIALWDLQGKALNTSVASLLGGALRKSMPIMWPVSDQSAEEDVKVLLDKAKHGYHSFMLKMSAARPVSDQVQRVVAINKAFEGKELHLNVDANNGWTLQQATQFAEGIKNEKLLFIEQPCHTGRLWEVEQLRKRTSHRLSADEDIQTNKDVMRICEQHLYDVFSLKVSKNGGIGNTRMLAQMADMYGIQIMFNSMLELGVAQAALLQLACVTPNVVDGGHCFMSTLRLADDITNFSSFCRDGVVTLPDAPGLGVEVDLDKLAKYSVDTRHVTK